MWASRSSVQGGTADERKCRMQRETGFRVDVMQVWRERRLEGGGTDWQCCRYGRTRAGRRLTTERGGRGTSPGSDSERWRQTGRASAAKKGRSA